MRRDEIYGETDRIMRALANLLEIPKDRQTVFISDLDVIWESAEADYHIYKKFSKRKDLAFRRVENAVLKARNEFCKLGGADRNLVDAVLKGMMPGDIVDFRGEPVFPTLDMLLSTMIDAFAVLTGRSPRHKKGDVRDWRLDWIVGASLFSFPQKHGGKPISFDHKKVGGGRKFQEAIKLLRHRDVFGIIPNEPPISTIKRIRKAALGSEFTNTDR
jgi:hypothetical protein